jgi:hypothetical protein
VREGNAPHIFICLGVAGDLVIILYGLAAYVFLEELPYYLPESL